MNFVSHLFIVIDHHILLRLYQTLCSLSNILYWRDPNETQHDISLLFGLTMTTAANASLLNNFEIVATAIIALLIFKEAISARLWLGIYYYVYAQRLLGAARTSAYYAVAPFIGAFLSLIIFREVPGVLFLAALALMVVGAWLSSGD